MNEIKLEMNDKRCFGQFGFMGSYCDLGCSSKYECIKTKNTMETKEVKIEIPEGYEIDNERSSFEKIVFKKKEKQLPKTWEEYFETADPVVSNNKLGGYGILSQYENAFIALNKLIRLRNVYNDEWKPDWNDSSCKYVITFRNNDIFITELSYKSKILSFKSKELRDEFYNNFKDLIEQAKELL